jgi:hypothetical protein
MFTDVPGATAATLPAPLIAKLVIVTSKSLPLPLPLPLFGIGAQVCTPPTHFVLPSSHAPKEPVLQGSPSEVHPPLPELLDALDELLAVELDELLAVELDAVEVVVLPPPPPAPPLLLPAPEATLFEAELVRGPPPPPDPSDGDPGSPPVSSKQDAIDSTPAPSRPAPNRPVMSMEQRIHHSAPSGERAVRDRRRAGNDHEPALFRCAHRKASFSVMLPLAAVVSVRLLPLSQMTCPCSLRLMYLYSIGVLAGSVMLPFHTG